MDMDTIYVRESLEWTRKIDIQVTEIDIGNFEAIANLDFYLLISKHPKLGFVCNWFGCQNDAPNNPKYSDVITKEDAWFGSEEAVIANTKDDLIAFLREFAKQ
jgi:hypothetical protein